MKNSIYRILMVFVFQMAGILNAKHPDPIKYNSTFHESLINENIDLADYFSICQLSFDGAFSNECEQTRFSDEEKFSSLKNELSSIESDIICIKNIPNLEIAKIISVILQDKFSNVVLPSFLWVKL